MALACTPECRVQMGTLDEALRKFKPGAEAPVLDGHMVAYLAALTRLANLTALLMDMQMSATRVGLLVEALGLAERVAMEGGCPMQAFVDRAQCTGTATTGATGSVPEIFKGIPCDMPLPRARAMVERLWAGAGSPPAPREDDLAGVLGVGVWGPVSLAVGDPLGAITQGPSSLCRVLVAPDGAAAACLTAPSSVWASLGHTAPVPTHSHDLPQSAFVVGVSLKPCAGEVPSPGVFRQRPAVDVFGTWPSGDVVLDRVAPLCTRVVAHPWAMDGPPPGPYILGPSYGAVRTYTAPGWGCVAGPPPFDAPCDGSEPSKEFSQVVASMVARAPTVGPLSRWLRVGNRVGGWPTPTPTAGSWLDSGMVPACVDVQWPDGSWLYLDSPAQVVPEAMAQAVAAVRRGGTLGPVVALVAGTPFHAMLVVQGWPCRVLVAGATPLVPATDRPATRVLVSILLPGKAEVEVGVPGTHPIQVVHRAPGDFTVGAFPCKPAPGLGWGHTRGGVPYEATVTLPPRCFIVLTVGSWVEDGEVFGVVASSHQAWARNSRRGTPDCLSGGRVPLAAMDPDFGWLDTGDATVPRLSLCVCQKQLEAAGGGRVG